MYEYFSGALVAKSPMSCTLDVGGVGYRLEIPLSTFERLPDSGAVQLHAHFYVAEGSQRLFGFATTEERALFRALLGRVQQVGPSKALAVLSALPVDRFCRAVREQDLQALSRIKGIGPKTAQRMLVELKDSVDKLLPGASAERRSDVESDARDALVELGYSAREAEEAAAGARKAVGAGAGVQDLLRHVLSKGAR